MIFLNGRGLLHEEVHDTVRVVVRCDLVLLAEQLLFRSDAAEHEERLESVVRTEENVRVESVSDHADLLSLQSELVAKVVDHERTGLADDGGLLSGAALDGADHAAVAGPLLRVRKMRDGVQVGSDELASGILVDAELRGLNLEVVDVTVEADHDGPDVLVLLDHASLAHVGNLLVVLRTSAPRYVYHVELLADADLADDVDLLTALLELGLFEVGGRREGRREDLLGGNVQTETVELLFVSRARLRTVVRHEEHFLAEGSELVEGLGNSRNQTVSPPDDTIAVENEDVDSVEQLGHGVGQFGNLGHVQRGRKSLTRSGNAEAGLGHERGDVSCEGTEHGERCY